MDFFKPLFALLFLDIGALLIDFQSLRAMVFSTICVGPENSYPVGLIPY